jgi:hypothetical protein
MDMVAMVPKYIHDRDFEIKYEAVEQKKFLNSP